MTCRACGKKLDTVDIGAHRKFIGWTRETLDEWILKFRRNGCLLFPPLEPDGK